MNLTEVLDFVNKQNTSKDNFRSSVSISILRNFTIEGIEPFLKYHHYKSGIDCNIHFGNFDNITQDLINLSTQTIQQDILVLALNLESISKFQSDNTAHSEIIDEVKNMFGLALSHSKSLINVNTFIPPFYSHEGISFLQDKPDVINEIEKVNSFIRDFVKEHNNRMYLSDWERIIRIIGLEAGMDFRFWYMSKSPFKIAFMDLYAKEITKISRALKGKNKKCLVLDCDNTLWGGIIGEDGLSKIKLDNDSYPGKVFYDFQKNILKLYERGILICLCSKNNEEDVWEVLDQHPHCLLKREHIIAHRINWNNKATGLTELAEELNIGLDSFVFLDDNETEIMLVNDMLPEVSTLLVPKRLYLYPQILFAEGLFDGLYQTDEDKKRSEMYHAEKKRKEDVKKFQNIEEFLKSLELKVFIREAAKEEIPRIAQLTQKTNQFNLTTRRYSEVQVESFFPDKMKKIYTLKVTDRFGDFGLTGVMIVFKEDSSAKIDTLLLSCRILGRSIEKVFVDFCLKDIISKWNPDLIAAEYLPTKKNVQTLTFWESLGFMLIEEREGIKSYRLNANEYIQSDISYIKINPS